VQVFLSRVSFALCSTPTVSQKCAGVAMKSGSGFASFAALLV